MNEEKKRYTIFCDIDGCILRHGNAPVSQLIHREEEFGPLPGVTEKFDEWNEKSYYIVITTARKECLRELTEKQLLKAGIHYDVLLMGVSNGPRVLINDAKPDGTITAKAFCVERNKGLGDIIL